jgi:hypothetical protein
MPHGKGR